MANKDELKAAKKAQRSAKRAKRKETRGQLWQAFKLQKSRDKKLIPYMLLGLLGPVLVLLLIGLLLGGMWVWFLPLLGLSIGFAVAMWIFTKRLEASFYSEAEGQMGAAGWALENMRSGVGVTWHVKTAAQANQQLDAVHRVIQAAFGWSDAHAHRFSLVADTALPEAQVRLDETIQETGDSLRYLYDDTDNWDHQIKLEKILDTTVPADAPDAAVTGGRRATPPENCGGLLTEAELVEVLDDPAHFDVAEANARLH